MIVVGLFACWQYARICPIYNLAQCLFTKEIAYLELNYGFHKSATTALLIKPTGKACASFLSKQCRSGTYVLQGLKAVSEI